MTKEQTEILMQLTAKLHELGFEAKPLKEISEGPLITAFRFMPTGRTTVAKLESLGQDFALTLGVEDILVKRMPGESAVAVFVPRKDRQLVRWLGTVDNVWMNYQSQQYTVPLNFGVDWLGKPYIENLPDLPHLLIAGSTGGGKSVFLRQMIATIVYCMNSRDVGFVLSDTKAVEFGAFIGAPHLLFEPATSSYQTYERMEWIVETMEKRLKELAKAGVQNIQEHNNSKRFMETHPWRPLPYIILVIDELADVVDKKVGKELLGKIVQKSRAAGVHVIAATQRAGAETVASAIKVNFPARLSFKMPDERNSKVAIGTAGAEHLLSQGDMLYSSSMRAGLQRLHAPFASNDDIKGAIEAATMREQMERSRL